MLKWIICVVMAKVTYNQQIKIVAPYEEGPEPCALICAGTTGIGTTKWTKGSGQDFISVTVDMSNCGFVSAPIVSTVLTGNGHTRSVIGTSGIYGLTNKKFLIVPTRIYNYDLYGRAIELKWRVDWQAVGFVC